MCKTHNKVHTQQSQQRGDTQHRKILVGVYRLLFTWPSRIGPCSRYFAGPDSRSYPHTGSSDPTRLFSLQTITPSHGSLIAWTSLPDFDPGSHRLLPRSCIPDLNDFYPRSALKHIPKTLIQNIPSCIHPEYNTIMSKLEPKNYFGELGLTSSITSSVPTDLTKLYQYKCEICHRTYYGHTCPTAPPACRQSKTPILQRNIIIIIQQRKMQRKKCTHQAPTA